MEKLLFLDFDGVLHSKTDRRFAKLGLLEKYLIQMPQLGVVISSTVRESNPFERLQMLFSPAVRHQIIGVTPVRTEWLAVGTRQREIEDYLESRALHAGSATWVALDDVRYYFDDTCSNLILVDGHRGFGDGEGRMLLEWYGKN